jgi:hypothetical protein
MADYIEEVDLNIGDHEYTIGVCSFGYFIPGRYYGPPELCYPDDWGDAEFDVLMIDGIEVEEAKRRGVWEEPDDNKIQTGLLDIIGNHLDGDGEEWLGLE